MVAHYLSMSINHPPTSINVHPSSCYIQILPRLPHSRFLPAQTEGRRWPSSTTTTRVTFRRWPLRALTSNSSSMVASTRWRQAAHTRSSAGEPNKDWLSSIDGHGQGRLVHLLAFTWSSHLCSYRRPCLVLLLSISLSSSSTWQSVRPAPGF